MFKKNDPYTFSTLRALNRGAIPTPPPAPKIPAAQIGNMFLEYQVTRYDDVQVAGLTSSSVAPKTNRKFLLHCTQTINIFNPDGEDVSPSSNLNSYNNYPVMINALMSLDTSKAASTVFQLMDYSPQTVNTKIQASASAALSTGASNGSSSSSTVGSSTSQTNSYGASVSVGTNGADVSANYEHSDTSTQDKSATSGSDSSRSRGTDDSNSASMSVKDWGAYALITPLQNPSWTFGQEYPWDAIQCRNVTDTLNPANINQNQSVIPNEMLVRLCDATIPADPVLYPASHLSTFGVNFVMKALWLITIDNAVASDEVTIHHVVNYFSGSHAIIKGATSPPSPVIVYMDKQPDNLNQGANPASIDLGLLALDPVGRQNSAIIGFIPNKFQILPAPIPASGTPAPPFKIVASTNDLMILDTSDYSGVAAADADAGFSPSETSLTASFSKNCDSLTMTMYFKVLDSVSDFALYMKHWKTGTTGVVLTFTINGDTKNQITKYVDALEAEGGEKNLLSIALRDQSYASVDYADFLQLGLNSIDIAIAPIDGTITAGSGYQIRAISIEKS